MSNLLDLYNQLGEAIREVEANVAGSNPIKGQLEADRLALETFAQSVSDQLASVTDREAKVADREAKLEAAKAALKVAKTETPAA